MSESFDVELGSPLPLSITLPDGASGFFPQVRIYDSVQTEVAGSPFDLMEVGSTGRYAGPSFTPLVIGNFTAHFIVYSDGSHTIEATIFERDQDSYIVKLKVADAVLDEINIGSTHNIQNSAGKQIRQASGGFESRDVVDATANTIELDSVEEDDDVFLAHRYVAIVDGLGANQVRIIEKWNGTTKIATLTRPWVIIPDATSKYLLLLSAESEPARAAETAATAGSTTTEIRTGLTQDDNVFNNMQVVIVDASGTAVARNVNLYTQLNGAITVAALETAPAVGDIVYILRRTGSTPLNPQTIRDALKLAPSAGAPDVGSTDDDLDIIKGAGFVTADDSLAAAESQRAIIQQDIDNFENITKIKISIPSNMERPESGTAFQEIYFNLKDDAGDPVDADGGGGGTITVQATAHGGVAGDRDGRLSATTMTNLSTGRYLVTFSIADSDILEGIHLAFSWAEGGNPDNVDKSFNVVDTSGAVTIDATIDVRIMISPLERPPSGSEPYDILVELRDAAGAFLDPDGNTLNIAAANQAGDNRSANLSAATMTRIAAGRYRVTYNVADVHEIEEVVFTFTFDVATVAQTFEEVETVIDATEAGSPLVGSGF